MTRPVIPLVVQTTRRVADVIVLGSGMGGLGAAIAAAEHGLSVIVLEAWDKLGGSTARSFGGIWVANNSIARARGLYDSRAAAMRYMDYLGAGQTDARRVAAFIHHAPRALDFFIRAGIDLRLSALGDHFYGSAEGSLPHARSFEVAPFRGSALGAWREKIVLPEGDDWRISLQQKIRNTPARVQELKSAATGNDELCLGVGLVAYALRSALQRGVSLLTGMRAIELVEDKDKDEDKDEDARRISGVVCANGERFTANCGVILACGGFESDVERVKEIENLADYRSVYLPTLMGDAWRMAAQHGAAQKIIRNNLGVLLGYEDPAGMHEVQVAANRELAAPHSLVVNRCGQRFGKEGAFQDMAPALRHFDARTRQAINLPAWLVFDRQFVTMTGLLPGGPGAVPDWVPRADSLNSLAQSVGMDAEGLCETVARFNTYAITGIDPEFGRGSKIWAVASSAGAGPNPALGQLVQPPFFALPLVPTILGASGLKADAQARVLDVDDQPMPGLYAVGNAAAHDEYGAGYQAGQSLSSAMTFALLAVEAIAEEATNQRAHHKAHIG